ncbi:MAG: phage tail assembly chaperone [Peptoanaerobacter stomatis]
MEDKNIGKNEEFENIQNEDVQDDNNITLEDFLASHTVENLTEEIVLNERLKDFKFKIGSMTRDELEKYQKLCVIRDKKGNVIKQDSMKFSELVIVNHLLYPNFKSQEFLQKLGVNTPAQGLAKVLKVGEITALSEKIMKFNGFDEDFEDIRAKAKN